MMNHDFPYKLTEVKVFDIMVKKIEKRKFSQSHINLEII